MQNELKPCPFCGGRVEETGGSCNYGKRIMTLSVTCTGCGTKFQLKAKFDDNPYTETIAAWNRRAHDEQTDKLED